MRQAIVTQCFGALGSLAFTNGLMLVYMTAQRIDSTRIVLYLALPMIADTLFRVPVAFYADRIGLKRAGLAGMGLQIVGFAALTASGSFPGGMNEVMLAAGAVLFSLGLSLQASSWFALLNPLVPVQLRGRFFGSLRFAWQLVSFAFATIYTCFLAADSTVRTYQIILAVILVGLVARVAAYAAIPELERPDPPKAPFRTAVGEVLRVNGAMPFGAYVFLISLFTAGCPVIIGLLEKDALRFGDAQVVWMGNLMMLGAIAGYLYSGRIIDRVGTKPVFIVCHLAFFAVLCLPLARGLVPAVLQLPFFGLINVLFGTILAASSVAITAEMLSLISPAYPSLSTSVNSSLMRAGGGAMGLAGAWILSHGLLNDRWTLYGAVLTRYDTILLACAVMILLLVVTLGLIPSLLRPHDIRREVHPVDVEA